MAEIISMEPALQSLDAVAGSIVLDNPRAVTDLIKAVVEKTDSLENGGYRGSVRRGARC
jgi:plasmid stabilization system protein ParE